MVVIRFQVAARVESILLPRRLKGVPLRVRRCPEGADEGSVGAGFLAPPEPSPPPLSRRERGSLCPLFPTPVPQRINSRQIAPLLVLIHAEAEHVAVGQLDAVESAAMPSTRRSCRLVHRLAM